MAMQLLDTIAVGAYQCNCSLVACGETNEAVLIDPGDDAVHILDMIRHHNVTVKALIHTHAHLDHVGATREVKQALGSPICLHAGDTWLYENLVMQGEWAGLPRTAPLPIDRFLKHAEEIIFGKCRLKVLHTPGHTPGSVCFHTPELQSILFSGDTLFQQSIGRTDLWGGDYAQIIESIRAHLLTLPPDTRVLPGHGSATHIGWEQKHNPFLI